MNTPAVSNDDRLPTHRLAEIRKRTERQGSRYGVRWNQIRRDRRDLLAEVDRLSMANAMLATALANAALRAAGCPLCMASQHMSSRSEAVPALKVSQS